MVDSTKQSVAQLVSSSTIEKILEHIGEVIVIIDAEGIIRYKSTNSERLFGWKPKEVIGANCLENIHPDDQEEAQFFLNHILENPMQSAVRELRYGCKDGTYKWIEFHAVNMLNDVDIGGILGNYSDITDRKLAEKKKTESMELLTNLAQLVPGVIYQYKLDTDGHSAFPYSSPGMIDIYEVTPEEVREDASPVFGRLHPDDTDEVSAKIVESARILENFYCEFRVVLPRQGLRWRWSQAFPQRTPDGGTLWHGIIMDITDRKEAEAEQERLNAQLTQARKMESVGRLAGGVAHDFNNMLGVIIGYAELLHDLAEPGDPCHSGLSQILNAAERSADLTRQLLAFSRRQTISPQSLDLNDTISRITTMLSRLIGEDITLTWQPVNELWPVILDPTQFQQILVNLCVNARDAIGGGGEITIAACNQVVNAEDFEYHENAVSGEFVMLTFRDTGAGMSESVRQKIFEPFFTTKVQGEGTGLGLSTVFGIVSQNSGCIRVESKEGEGTVFYIYLKRHIPIDEPLEEFLRERVPVYVDSATILLVEDESALLPISLSMLESSGYKVLPASSPTRAIEIAKSYSDEITLLLTDVIMPGMNGRELLHEIQSIRPGIRHLFMSGYTADVIAPYGILEKGVMFIPKPFNKQNLVDKVKEALGVRLKL